MTIVVDIDPQKWAQQNGTEATAAAVRADVARYIASSVTELPAVRDAEVDQ